MIISYSIQLRKIQRVRKLYLDLAHTKYYSPCVYKNSLHHTLKEKRLKKVSLLEKKLK